MKPDLVVLDSPDQLSANPLIRGESRKAKNTCGNQANCPTFVPSWVSGERLEASQKVLDALSTPNP